VLSGRT